MTKKLSDIINKLESNIPHHELTAPIVSKGSVGWHTEHSLLVFNAVLDALKKSIPENYKSKFSINRSFVMITGKIPRGKVKAPTAVQPGSVINLVSLEQHLLISKEKLKIPDQLSNDHYFKHPFLGDFKLKHALRFLNIHTKHHLRIIDDIISNSK